jgi:hypothetical protein
LQGIFHSTSKKDLAAYVGRYSETCPGKRLDFSNALSRGWRIPKLLLTLQRIIKLKKWFETGDNKLSITNII